MLFIPTISHSKTIIDADQLNVNFQENIAIFKGNVQIIGDEITFAADLVEVTLLDNFKDLSKIKSIIAKNNKKMINASIKRDKINYTLQCREIIIDMITKQITATDATLSNDRSHMVGEKIIYNIDDGKVFVSGKKRVKILIEDESKKAG